MIISRSPLRISIAGGGTDIPSYYKRRGGYLISAAIDKFVYISLAETYKKKFLLKYSKLEEKTKIKFIKHPLFREILKELKIKKYLNISSHAEIPSGTGLGSSGAFSVALIKALSEFKNDNISNKSIASLACKIEINKLKEPVGKQDQYVSALGGFREYFFFRDGRVVSRIIKIKKKTLKNLNKKLSLYFTGYTRSSYKILKHQDSSTKKSNLSIIKNLDEVKSLAIKTKKYLINNDLDSYGRLLDYHWQIKKERSKKISNDRIDKIYNYAKKNSALGGKLVGAGGGGFLIFYSNKSKYLEKKLYKKFKLRRVNFQFLNTGVEILNSDKFVK